MPDAARSPQRADARRRRPPRRPPARVRGRIGGSQSLARGSAHRRRYWRQAPAPEAQPHSPPLDRCGRTTEMRRRRQAIPPPRRSRGCWPTSRGWERRPGTPDARRSGGRRRHCVRRGRQPWATHRASGESMPRRSGGRLPRCRLSSARRSGTDSPVHQERSWSAAASA